VQAINAEIAVLDRHIDSLVRATAPGLAAVYGVGADTAAILLVAAGDNATRIHSEAAWAHLCGVAPIPAGSPSTPPAAAKVIQPVQPVGWSYPVGSSYPVGRLYPVGWSYDGSDIAPSSLAVPGPASAGSEGRIGVTVRRIIDGVFSQTG
jgi:hypothetical protein